MDKGSNNNIFFLEKGQYDCAILIQLFMAVKLIDQIKKQHFFIRITYTSVITLLNNKLQN